MFCTSLCGGLQTNVVLGMNRAEFVKLMMAGLGGHQGDREVCSPSASLLHHTETGSRADVYFYVFPPTFSHVTLSVSQVTHRCLCLSDHITAGRLGEYAGEVW